MHGILAHGLLLLAVLVTAFAQVAFKQYHLTGRRAALATAIGLFASIPPVTFMAVRELGVGRVYVFTSLSYALVAFLGWKLFKERITPGQAAGLAMIVCGCLVYTF